MPSKAIVPKLWPPELQYTNVPIYTSSVTKDVLSSLHTPPGDTAILSQDQQPNASKAWVRIGPISNHSHPAHGQNGLFATKALPPSSLIIFYIGLVHTSVESDLSSDYDLSLDRDLGLGIDAAKCGNEARFINDYRGVAEGPNAEFKDVWIKLPNGTVERRMAVCVLPLGHGKKRAKGIGKGVEILVSYGKGFWKERGTNETHANETND